jgi:putative restriction endonuclease
MPRGYIGNTDHDWYSFLRQQKDLDEVNFWQPSGGRSFHSVQPGEPFFFRLKSPYKAIGGFGFFTRHSVASAALAWDAFGVKNGAPDWRTMHARIEKYRRDRGGEHMPGGNYQIGCLMISHPVFFAPDDWVPEPAGWAQNIVAGMGVDTTIGEGKRIFEACLDRMLARADPNRPPPPEIQRDKYGTPILVKPRLGQGAFRIAVTDAYGKACAVTREHSMPTLEAAHIRPYGTDGEHQISNGLLLRADLHKLFDKGYVTVTPELVFEVSSRLKQDFDNGKVYYDMRGQKLYEPQRHDEKPDRVALLWHNESVFLG